MKELVSKFIEIERRTSSEKGEYDLFALFLREGSSDKWDILVAAEWISKNKQLALKYLSQIIQQSFNLNELLKISRIVIVEEDEPALPAIQQTVTCEHSSIEIKDSNFFGLEIKHAYLITSKRRNAEVQRG